LGISARCFRKERLWGRWMGWIRKILHRGSVGVTVNNMEGEFFETGKGPRQGDPLSSILFNFVVDILSRMLQKATRVNLIRGLGEDLIEGSVVSLQYADDTILFLGKEEAYARNLKWILTCFEMMSGMRINYHKSELVLVCVLEMEEMQIYSDIFGCPVGDFPIKYLGIPLHYQKLRREDLQPLIDKIIKRIAGWRGKLLTQARRIVLIKTCLASIPVYLLSYFKFPKWAIDLINSHMANCLWDDYEGHRKLHLANWHLICMKKDYGV
jgi:hypothetical protein